MSEPLGGIYWRLGAQYDGSVDQVKPRNITNTASPGVRPPTYPSLLDSSQQCNETPSVLMSRIDMCPCRGSSSISGWLHGGSSATIDHSLHCVGP